MLELQRLDRLTHPARLVLVSSVIPCAIAQCPHARVRRRESGTSPSRPPSTRRCSDSPPPHTECRFRPHQALQPGIVLPGERTFSHSSFFPRNGCGDPSGSADAVPLDLTTPVSLPVGAYPRGALRAIIPAPVENKSYARARSGNRVGHQFNGGCGICLANGQPVRIPCGGMDVFGLRVECSISASVGQGSSEDVLGMSRSISIARRASRALGGTGEPASTNTLGSP